MNNIIRETIESLKTYIPKLIHSAESMAENLQGGDQEGAMQQLPLFFEGIDWVINAFNGLSNNNYHIDIEVSSLNKYLIEIEEAIQIKDVILLADLLEYEIKPIIEDWLNKCNIFTV